MANYSGRLGAPMLQPPKSDYRRWLAESQKTEKEERQRRRAAEFKLGAARRLLGKLVIEGKIDLPIEQVGECVIQNAMKEEAELEAAELQILASKN